MDSIQLMSNSEIGKTIEKAMRIAIEEAEAAKREGENPYGAVLLDPEYHFCHKAHSRSIERSDPTAHAEMSTLKMAGQSRPNAEKKGLLMA